MQKSVKFLTMFPAVMALVGCASAFFPDFDEGSDIVVDDGGKVEIRKVEEKGVLVGDKDNALYEDGDEELEVAAKQAKAATSAADAERRLAQVNRKSDDECADKVEPAKVAKVTREEIAPQNQHPKAEERIDAPAVHYLAGVVYFANGGAYIDNEGMSKLRSLAKDAKKHNAKVEVFGFASSRTRNTDPVSHKLANFEVSAKRAENVAAALRRLGVDKSRIEVQALSDSMPMYKEVMPEGERLNRRAEIYLTY